MYRSNKPIRRTTSSVSFYINQGMNWSSVLNDQFLWGKVEEIGEILSNFVLEPVMTIGFFDEDIFEFTIFQEGDIRIKKYFCEEWAKEEYGLESEVIDHEYLEKVLELAHEDLVKILEISNPEQAIDELSRMIQIHL